MLGAVYPLDVTCELSDGVLILHGQVPTFFQKQLAQEAVFDLDGVTQVVNQIEVVGPPNHKGLSEMEWQESSLSKAARRAMPLPNTVI